MAAYSTYTDQELVGLLKRGDQSAFNEVFIRYHPLLLNFTYKKIKVRDEAQDILQDIFVRLWNGRNDLSIVSLSSYLYTVALNRIRDRYKHQVIHDEHLVKLQQLMDDKAQGADFLIREKDITLLIEKEIAALPEKMREVFLLRKNAFMSNKEIAEQLGISEQTVETHMKRAIKTLKHRLGPAVLLVFNIFLIYFTSQYPLRFFQSSCIYKGITEPY